MRCAMYGKAEIGGNLEITGIYTAFKRDYKTGYYFSGEFHDFWEIVIVLSGEIGITAGSRVMRLSRGQCVLHCPSEFHRIWNDNSLHPQIIIFSFACRNMPGMKSRFFSISDELLAEAEATLGEINCAFERSGISVVGIKNADSLDYLTAAKKLELFILHAAFRAIPTILRRQLPRRRKTTVRLSAQLRIISIKISIFRSLPKSAA